MRRAPRRAAPRGFTLIEVLIAAGLLAMIGASVFGSFRQAWAQKEQVGARDERYAQARAALDRISTDIASAFLSEHFDRRRFQQRPTLFVGKDNGREDELLFSALTAERQERDQKTGDQQMLKYFVDDVPNARPPVRALFRRSRPIIDEESERRGLRQVLCEHVKQLQLQYWDGQRSEWVDEWDAARSEHAGVLPERVRIELTLEEPDGQERTFTTQTRIMLRRSLDF